MSYCRMTLCALFQFLLLTLLGQQCHSLYDNHTSHVIVLNDDFHNKVLNSDSVWFIQFYDPGCVHSQQFAPKYERLAMILRGIVPVGAVDASTEAGAMLAAKYNVKGFPTLFTFSHDKTNPQQYQGSRDSKGMSQFLISAIMEVILARDRGIEPPNRGPSKLVELSDDNFDRHVLNNPQVSVVAFVSPACVHCAKLMPIWEEAAHRLADHQALVGIVDATIERGLADDYGVTSFPTIFVFPGGHNKPEPTEYNGVRSSDHIYDFVMDEITRSGVSSYSTCSSS